jgi:hypothetical protein
MGADQNGDRGDTGAPIGQAKLKPRRASVVREAWDRLLDFAIAAWLGAIDRFAPLHETPVDRAIREEGERLRKAFPAIDFDNPGSRRSRSSGARCR